MTLETIRAKKEGKFLGQTLKGAFENRFAQRLYKFARRLEVDEVGFTNKVGCAELLNKYVYPRFGNDIYAFLLHTYFEFRGYNVVLSSGVMASRHFRVNKFFDAHLIQLFSQCADQTDPELLIMVGKIAEQLESLKQLNANTIMTQIMTQQLYPPERSPFKQINQNDDMYNFKMFVEDCMFNYCMN